MVVGDLMVDEWIWGTVTRISPEAPVPVVAVADHSFTLGGAGNVANNLRALRASVAFAGAVGDDAFAAAGARPAARRAGRRFRGLHDRAIGRRRARRASSRTASRSCAPIGNRRRRCRTRIAHRLAEFVRERAPQCDAVILSDYAKGLLCREIVEAASRCPLVLADPKPQNIDALHGITCVAPNVGRGRRR